MSPSFHPQRKIPLSRNKASRTLELDLDLDLDMDLEQEQEHEVEQELEQVLQQLLLLQEEQCLSHTDIHRALRHVTQRD